MWVEMMTGEPAPKQPGQGWMAELLMGESEAV